MPDSLRVEVTVPVPDGEDPKEYAERVASWSICTLQQGRIRSADVVPRDLDGLPPEEVVRAAGLGIGLRAETPAQAFTGVVVDAAAAGETDDGYGLERALTMRAGGAHRSDFMYRIELLASGRVRVVKEDVSPLSVSSLEAL